MAAESEGFVIELATRKVIWAGVTLHPEAVWMQSIGRNLTDTISGFLVGKHFLILDQNRCSMQALADCCSRPEFGQ